MIYTNAHKGFTYKNDLLNSFNHMFNHMALEPRRGVLRPAALQLGGAQTGYPLWTRNFNTSLPFELARRDSGNSDSGQEQSAFGLFLEKSFSLTLCLTKKNSFRDYASQPPYSTEFLNNMYPSVLIFSGKERHHCFVFLLLTTLPSSIWWSRQSLAFGGFWQCSEEEKRSTIFFWPVLSENINAQAIPTFQVYQKFPLLSSPNHLYHLNVSFCRRECDQNPFKPYT